MPVSPNRPYAFDGAVLPVRGLSYFGGATMAGGKTPVSVRSDEHFSRSKKTRLVIKEHPVTRIVTK